MGEARQMELYRDPSQSAERRADDLIGRMTTEEKAAQLAGRFPFSLIGPTGLDPDRLQNQLRYGVGHLSGLTNMFPSDAASLVSLVRGRAAII